MAAEAHRYRSGIIGNCSFMAHIDDRADVKWLCWPRFDSSFIFGGLLDQDRGGCFRVEPGTVGQATGQSYVDNTNILCTDFTTPEGCFRVTDFAPRFREYERRYKPLMLVRKIEPLSGSPKVRVLCRPKGEYGALQPEHQLGSNHIRYGGLGAQVRLTTDIPLNFVLEERELVLNEPKYLVLTWGIPLEAPLQWTAETLLRRTTDYWQDWVKQCTIGDFYQRAVIRSALALKLHQYEDTGAIIASGTTSLPEAPGSGRNWDYRYCWMRDTYYTLTALGFIGHFSELERYAHYVQNIATESPGQYGPVYSIAGDQSFAERTVELAGYLGNQPVRVGNQALEHVQNDVYGQVLTTLLPLYVDPRFPNQNRTQDIQLPKQVLAAIERTIDEPDAGLWEFRGRAQRHCYTFLFHWAGALAAAKIGQHYGDDEMAHQARALAARAADNIEACYDEELGAYTQAVGVKHLDASLLQLITMGYLDPNSERARRHLDALERGLSTGGGLFYRYKHADDFGEPETSFLICAFWYVEALAVVGRVDDAIEAFEQLVGYGNHLGLLSEDIDPKNGAQWGNFPQAYSHVGLMNAAFRIARRLDRPSFL